MKITVDLLLSKLLRKRVDGFKRTEFRSDDKFKERFLALGTMLRLMIVCLATINFSVLYRTFFAQGEMSFFSCAVYSIADALVVFLPFIFVRRKLLYITLLWFLTITILIYCNILYFRNFNDAICGASYFVSGGLNRFVADAVFASVRFTDIIIAVTTLSAVIIAVRAYRIDEIINKYFIYSYIAITVLFVIGQVGLSVRRISIFNHIDRTHSVMVYRQCFNLKNDRMAYMNDWKTYVLNYGFTGYLTRVILDCMQTRQYEVSEMDILEVKKFLHKNNHIAKSDSVVLTDLQINNCDKNLILIIVESFNSKVLELDEVNEVAPSIKKWSEDSTALYFPNIEAMTGHGGSSDGQFMINTGILPLQAEALVSRYADADYPSLAKILGYNSIEVIGENRSVWSHYLTTKSYGYDRLVDNILPNKTPIAIQDSLIFAKAKDEIKNMVQPFFVQITTIGMHKPYTRDTGVTINLNNDYPISDRHYFEAVYTFDKNCGNFIEELKKLGIYEKSVIVIVADHEESMPELSETFNEKRIPMLILNSSLSCNEKYTDGRYRQIDI